ncbi:high mobility group nucleosome-binding domain-containing protein 5-like [Macrobrachium nipponense]|uniref:high mobility group nucleosome-binding domain-containing protein 5-like n=1 Tax=Macrobrachium nipponense TaxID=159736 RepID=UPI0030C7A835
MMNAVQEMKEFMGEGAIGGRPTGSFDGPGAIKEVKEQVDESTRHEGDLVVIRKGKKGKKQDKDKPEDKNKKGAEKKKKTEGNKVSKDDGQDETRIEYIGEMAESDLDSGEWKQAGKKKKGKESVIKSMDVSREVDLLYSEEVKRDQNGSSESENEQEVKEVDMGNGIHRKRGRKIARIQDSNVANFEGIIDIARSENDLLSEEEIEEMQDNLLGDKYVAKCVLGGVRVED